MFLQTYKTGEGFNFHDRKHHEHSKSGFLEEGGGINGSCEKVLENNKIIF